MAILTNTFTSYQSKGHYQEWEEMIYMVSYKDTPVLASLPEEDIESKIYNWQEDTLPTPLSAAALEADAFAATAVTGTTELRNVCEIKRRDFTISNSNIAQRKYGMSEGDVVYQQMKYNTVLRQEQELSIFLNKGLNLGNNTTPRELRGLPSWISTNTDLGTGGANAPNETSSRTDGTTRAFTETLLTNVLEKCWSNGATPSLIVMNAAQKKVFSTFVGRATDINTNADNTVVNKVVEVYVSDFGEVSAVLTKFCRSRDVFLIDPTKASIAYLRRMNTVEGELLNDGRSFQMSVEYTLKVGSERAHGAVYDLS